MVVYSFSGIAERIVGRNLVNRIKETYHFLTDGRTDNLIESYFSKQRNTKSVKEHYDLVNQLNNSQEVYSSEVVNTEIRGQKDEEAEYALGVMTKKIFSEPRIRIDDEILGKLEQNLLETIREKRKNDPVIKQLNQGIFGKVFDIYTLLRHPVKNAKKIRVYDKIKDSQKDLLKALLLCQEVRTSRKAMEERADSNHENKALRDWLEGPKQTLENNLRIANECSDIYEGFAFGGRVDYFINQDHKARKKAIAFYDFATKELYYNAGARAMLRLKAESAHTSLKELLRTVENEENKEEKEEKYVSKRRSLFNSLKEGKALDGFEIHPINASKKKLKIYLTTRPISYDSKKGEVTRRKSFGILMFLNKPSFFGHYKEFEDKKYAIEILDGLTKHYFKSIYDAIGNVR